MWRIILTQETPTHNVVEVVTQAYGPHQARQPSQADQQTDQGAPPPPSEGEIGK